MGFIYLLMVSQICVFVSLCHCVFVPLCLEFFLYRIKHGIMNLKPYINIFYVLGIYQAASDTF